MSAMLKVKYNNEVWIMRDLAAKHNLNASTLRTRIQRDGQLPRKKGAKTPTVTEEMLGPVTTPSERKIPISHRGPSDPSPAFCKRRAEIVNFEPGSWEKKHLASAGMNGFCKNERATGARIADPVLAAAYR